MVDLLVEAWKLSFSWYFSPLSIIVLASKIESYIIIFYQIDFYIFCFF